MEEFKTKICTKCGEEKPARLQKELEEFNRTNSAVYIREIESKGFDDTTHIKDNFDL